MKMLLVTCLFSICTIGCGPSKNTASGQEASALRGKWQLNYISGPRITFDGLYPDKKPFLTFETTKKKISGNTSCNSFSGTFTIDGKQLKFADNLVMTRMACDGDGETTFLHALKNINGYDVTAGYTLTLLMDDVAMMRFTKVFGRQ